MRQILLLPLAALLAMPVFSQTPADTTLTIQNIEIQGTRFAGLSERGGMKILRVDNNLSSVTNTAADAFRQLPSVLTDMEGAVTYRGSGNVGMFINGVPYGLLEEYSGDVLIQLPALFFNQISLGSFPPINAVPDGDAGILNLVPRMYGTGDSPLYVTLGAGWNERYNAGAVLNLHPGKFHINAKYNYRREYRERSFSKSTATAKNRTEMNNNATARPDVHVADMKVDYDLSAKDRITVHGLYHLMDYSRYGRINNRVFNPKGEQMKYVIRNRYNDQRQEAYAAEAYWNHEIAENQVFTPYSTIIISRMMRIMISRMRILKTGISSRRIINLSTIRNIIISGDLDMGRRSMDGTLVLVTSGVPGKRIILRSFLIS